MTFTGPYLDDSETYGPAGVASPSSTIAPFFDGSAGFGHGISGTTTAGLQVYSGSTLLANTLSRNFRDTRDDAGSFSFQMPRDVFTGVDFDDVITYKLDGVAVFAGIVEQIDHDAKAQGEKADQLVTVSGRGSLALLDQAIVYPSRGVDSLPIEETRSFSWPAPDFDDTDWPLAKQVNLQRSYADWRSPLPSTWPDTTGYWIWGNLPTVTAIYAPVGECLFRQTVTLADDSIVRVFAAGDNYTRLWIDGAEMAEVSSFLDARFTELSLTAGDHVIAAKVKNRYKAGLPNPGGFICAMYTIGSTGLLDTLVTHTDGTWKCLPYPVVAPGFTHGEVLINLLTEAQAADALTGVTYDFTAEHDSAGNPWSEYREITVQVGRSLLDVVEEMANTYIDVEMAPGSRVLRAWNYGARGNTRSVTLAQTTSPATSDFRSLSHKGKRTRLNRALIRYSEGHLEETDSASITAVGSRGGYIELGAISGEAEARQVAANLITSRAAESWSTSAVLLPSSTATTPYTSFGIGDTITCPDETDANASMRVWSISMSQSDDNGVIEWPVELQDQAYIFEERHAAWLTRMAKGALMGGAKVSSPASKPDPMTQQVTALRVAEFSFDNVSLVASLSPRRPAEVSGNIVEVYGELTTAGSTSTVIDVLFNGVNLTTLTFAAGETETEEPVTIEPVQANIDKVQVEIVTAGVGAAGLDIQVRAL